MANFRGSQIWPLDDVRTYFCHPLRWTTCWLVLGVAGSVMADASLAPLALLYSERAPFMQKQANGAVTGTTATPALRAFTQAGVVFTLREASPARRLAEVKENKGRVCSIGFYKTSEREAYARFSKPVSQDGKMIGLVNAKLQVPKGISVEAFLQREDVNVLMKESINYGPYLEAQFAKMRARRVATTSEYAQLFNLIKHERAQLLFMPEEEAHFYLKDAGYPVTDFKLLAFATMPPGEQRYIMCSQQVPDDVIAALNKAIDNPKP